MNDNLDMVSILKDDGATTAIVALVSSLPIGDIIVGVWLLVGIVFLATTMDSSSYTLATATTKNLRTNDHPDRSFKMFWSFLLIAVPLAFMFANASLSSLQSLAVLTAVPIGFLTLLAMLGGYLYARDMFGHLSGAEMFARNRAIRIRLGEVKPVEDEDAV